MDILADTNVSVGGRDVGAGAVYLSVMQGVKDWLPDGWNRFLPLIGLPIAVGVTFLVNGVPDWKSGLVKGVLFWLSSSGLYRNTKVTFGFEKKAA